MANRITRDTALVGNLAGDIGFSAFAIGSGLAITPNSAIAASAIAEITYTTGLAALSLAAGDFVMIHPKTALASGLVIAGARGAANGIIITWANVSADTSTPSATNYDVFAIRRSPQV